MGKKRKYHQHPPFPSTFLRFLESSSSLATTLIRTFHWEGRLSPGIRWSDQILYSRDATYSRQLWLLGIAGEGSILQIPPRLDSAQALPVTRHPKLPS
jgi:hypothetical protein